MKIGELLRIRRKLEKQGLREAAKEMGIKFTTLSRIENNKNVDGKTMIKLLIWLLS